MLCAGFFSEWLRFFFLFSVLFWRLYSARRGEFWEWWVCVKEMRIKMLVVLFLDGEWYCVVREEVILIDVFTIIIEMQFYRTNIEQKQEASESFHFSIKWISDNFRLRSCKSKKLTIKFPALLCDLYTPVTKLSIKTGIQFQSTSQLLYFLCAKFCTLWNSKWL